MCLGSALDILEAGRPPRATFVDYPLGHTAGKPFDEADQDSIVMAALQGLVDAERPGQIRMLTNVWPDQQWRTEASAADGGDTRQPRDETPQFQLPQDRDAALASGAWQMPA